jgi:hypothetical protein
VGAWHALRVDDGLETCPTPLTFHRTVVGVLIFNGVSSSITFVSRRPARSGNSPRNGPKRHHNPRTTHNKRTVFWAFGLCSWRSNQAIQFFRILLNDICNYVLCTHSSHASTDDETSRNTPASRAYLAGGRISHETAVVHPPFPQAK